MISALADVYKISYPLGTVLSLGGIALDGHGLFLDLEGLSAHNKIEHDASIVSFCRHTSAGSKLTLSVGS
jgi:hypothetical protein